MEANASNASGNDVRKRPKVDKIPTPHSTLRPSDVRVRAAHPTYILMPMRLLFGCPIVELEGHPGEGSNVHSMNVSPTFK